MKKRGVTLITVSIIVLTLLILATTVVVSAQKTIVRSRKMLFAKEIMQVQAQVDNYILRRSGRIDFETKSIELPQQGEEQFSGVTVEGLMATFYIVDLYKVDIESSNYGDGQTNDEVDDTDVYLYSNETKKVYYQKGATIDGNVYYTLTEELEDMVR